MPRANPEELTALLEVEPSALALELARRYPGADPAAIAELRQGVLSVRAQARSLTPPPTREELALGLLALFALHEARPR